MWTSVGLQRILMVRGDYIRRVCVCVCVHYLILVFRVLFLFLFFVFVFVFFYLGVLQVQDGCVLCH